MIHEIKQLGKTFTFYTLLVAPVEISRLSIMGVGIVPLLLFSGIEYVSTGNNEITEIIANVVEFGGKYTLQKIDIDNNILGSRYLLYDSDIKQLF